MSQSSKSRVFLVAVALGAKARCQREVKGSGSLILCPSITGDQHTNSECEPFFIGHPIQGEFVHVLDDVTLDVILRELDTFSDFVHYLRCKEDFINEGKLEIALGEENLLAYFLSKADVDGRHVIHLPEEFDRMQIHDNLWNEHVVDPQNHRKKIANRDSYDWDRLINLFCKHTVDGTQIATNSSSLSDAEIGLRIMAKEPRINRRMLATAWIDLLTNAPKDIAVTRTVISEINPETGYVYLIFPESSNIDEDRITRQFLLHSYCEVIAYRRKLRQVVGIATEPGLTRPISSYDFCVWIPEKWTDDQVKRIELLQNYLNFLNSDKTKITHHRDKEYPIDMNNVLFNKMNSEFDDLRHALHVTTKARRNDLCPCGSGKKFKNCCLG